MCTATLRQMIMHHQLTTFCFCFPVGGERRQSSVSAARGGAATISQKNMRHIRKESLKMKPSNDIQKNTAFLLVLKSYSHMSAVQGGFIVLSLGLRTPAVLNWRKRRIMGTKNVCSTQRMGKGFRVLFALRRSGSGL